MLVIAKRKGIVIMYEEEKDYREEAVKPADSQYQSNSQIGESRQDSYSEQWYSQDRQPEWEASYNRMNVSHIPPEPVKTPGKKRPVMAKVAGITAAALLFGTVAGGTMFGVNTAGEYLRGKYGPREQTQASLSVVEPQTTEQNANKKQAEVVPALQMDVSSIVEAAMPSVVAVTNTVVMEQRSWFGPSQRYEIPSSGSGIIVGQNNDELLIVTNNHVVEDSKELAVTFIDESSVTAAIKGTDSENDLAVIAVPIADVSSETMEKIKIATLGDSDVLRVGEGVIAIGNALGYGQSVTVGYVSAKDREVRAQDATSRDLLQTDAAINPGNSGGALLNMRGEVIGINVAKYSSTEVEGMGYAIPVSKVQDIINELMNRKTRMEIEESKQGYLGIQGTNIDDVAAAAYGMPRGVYVYKIVEGGAAANSDLREKDIITKFDGQTVRSMADLQKMLTYYEGNSTINLTVRSLENGEYIERTVEITLGYKAEAETN
ncbi:MAG: trypsin-like serine protease [Lachnospiraceae bacterium]|nr:trypsin-like serine protease [Lachnospiraceae bacterium]